MTTQSITIENVQVTIRPTANGVWLTQSQIADLFGVFTAAVSTNIRVVLKSGILHEKRAVHRMLPERKHRRAGISTKIRKNAEVFRQWIVEQAIAPEVV